MEKLKSREHDFGSKLRQVSVVERLKEYIAWARKTREGSGNHGFPCFSPISINLDLTAACNFACRYCVDSELINSGKAMGLEDLRKTIDVLHSHGLLSVILIGGGEPTLYKDFGKVVRYLKGKGLQVGIVTNGTRMDRIEEIAQELKEKDWVRISIDAAREETFRDLHRPKTRQGLARILEGARRVKEKNPTVSMGYSFVIIWEGMEINGSVLRSNLEEIAEAAELAKRYSFDYLSVKPCLVRLEETKRESLLEKVDETKEREIIESIKIHLEKAKEVAGDRIKILESVNLRAMLSRETGRIKSQPRTCHMPFFRTVVTPSGIFHCPAFRGVAVAKVGEKEGYATEGKFKMCLETTADSMSGFDAQAECKVIGCFYHDTNWWVEEFIQSREGVESIQGIEDENFFF
jgi:molybdenum cofactor biosynthesis enzyme MoaA